MSNQGLNSLNIYAKSLELRNISMPAAMRSQSSNAVQFIEGFLELFAKGGNINNSIFVFGRVPNKFSAGVVTQFNSIRLNALGNRDNTIRFFAFWLPNYTYSFFNYIYGLLYFDG